MDFLGTAITDDSLAGNPILFQISLILRLALAILSSVAADNFLSGCIIASLILALLPEIVELICAIFEGFALRCCNSLDSLRCAARLRIRSIFHFS